MPNLFEYRPAKQRVVSKTMRTMGFSVAEAMIMLIMIGVLATMIIPKFIEGPVAGQMGSHERAVFRETLRTLEGAMMEGRVSGEMSYQNFGDYMMTKMKGVKKCPTHSLNEGCWTSVQGNIGLNEPIEPGLVLHNGANIVGFANNGYFGGDSWASAVLIDWNGNDGPNQLGVDQMHVYMCYGKDRCQIGTMINMEPGQARPLGWGVTPNYSQVTLYNRIMKDTTQ